MPSVLLMRSSCVAFDSNSMPSLWKAPKELLPSSSRFAMPPLSKRKSWPNRLRLRRFPIRSSEEPESWPKGFLPGGLLMRTWKSAQPNWLWQPPPTPLTRLRISKVRWESAARILGQPAASEKSDVIGIRPETVLSAQGKVRRPPFHAADSFPRGHMRKIPHRSIARSSEPFPPLNQEKKTPETAGMPLWRLFPATKDGRNRRYTRFCAAHSFSLNSENRPSGHGENR